jgi:hypothetical protein
VILPGVEVGPRTIVAANSVVSRSLPADTVCVGSPAKPICSLDDYLARHRERLAKTKSLSWADYNADALTPERLKELLEAVANGPAYLVGGFSAELEGRGGTERTPYDESAKPHGVAYLKRRDHSSPEGSTRPAPRDAETR